MYRTGSQRQILPDERREYSGATVHGMGAFDALSRDSCLVDDPVGWPCTVTTVWALARTIARLQRKLYRSYNETQTR